MVHLFRYILLLLLALNLFEHITIEVEFLDTLSLVVFLVCVLFTVHACTKLRRDFLNLLASPRSIILCSINNYSQSVDQAFLWIIEIWKGDWEIKYVDELVSLVFDSFSQIHKVLVHNKGFLDFIDP